MVTPPPKIYLISFLYGIYSRACIYIYIYLHIYIYIYYMIICEYDYVSKKSPTGPSEWTPKPEYLIALAPYLGVHW